MTLLRRTPSPPTAKRAFTPADMTCLPRVSSPAVSPDGTYAVYTVFRYSIDGNSATRSLRVIRLCDHLAKDLTPPSKDTKDDGAVWLDDSTLAYLSTANGRTHVWTRTLTRASSLAPCPKGSGARVPDFSASAPTQLTDLPVDVSDLAFHAYSGLLAFSASVYPGLSLAETAEKAKAAEDRPDTALAYDQLFVRHWDHFVPETRNHLFTLPLQWGSNSAGHGKTWSVPTDASGPPLAPTDLLNGTELESPVRPFGGVDCFTFSPNGREIAFVAKVPGREVAWQTSQHIYVVPTDLSSAPRSVTPAGVGASSAPLYSPDGHTLAWLEMPRAQYEADRNQIVLLDRRSGIKTHLAPSWDRSPSSFLWSPESDAILPIVPEEGRDRLYYLALSPEEDDTVDAEATPKVQAKYDGKHAVIDADPIRLTELHSVSHAQFIPLPMDQSVASIGRGPGSEARGLGGSGGRLLLSMSSMTRPTELYTLCVDGESLWDEAGALRAPNHLTSESDSTLSALALSSPEDVWFTGAKGEKVHGFFLKPHGWTEGKKYPLAFIIHGGPQSAIGDSFSTRWNNNCYTGAGFAVLAINFHGSSGYGQAFTDSIRGSWGSLPYEDLMKGLDHTLAAHPWIDVERVAALGASYGGFMINWLNGHTDRFACLVNHDGIFSTIGTYFTSEELYFPEHEFGGTPWEAPEMYDRWNPAKFITNWKTPTLVIHGGKDYRLVDGEGLSTFTALQRQNIPSRLLYFPDENHWVLKPANSLRWHKEVLHWISQWTTDGSALLQEHGHIRRNSGGWVMVDDEGKEGEVVSG